MILKKLHNSDKYIVLGLFRNKTVIRSIYCRDLYTQLDVELDRFLDAADYRFEWAEINPL